MQVSLVDLRRFVSQQSCLDDYTRSAQVSKTFSGNFRVQVFDRRHHALDPGGDEGVSARRRTPVMRVRLERDVRRTTACFFPRDFERDRLGVLDGFKNVEAFTNDLTSRTDDDTTNQWPRTHLAHTPRRQIERTRH